MKWHGFWEEIYVGSWCFFFSSVLCFLRGTSLKRARDDFPLHALVIIWEGEFIRGRKSPGAKKKEPHHGQGRLGALWNNINSKTSLKSVRELTVFYNTGGKTDTFSIVLNSYFSRNNSDMIFE